MEEIEIEGMKYQVIENKKEGLNLEEIKKLYTDYFKDFDYIVGDWAYGKLRLKGFNEKKNPNFKEINNKEKIKEYIENYCAYECAYFILKKEK